MTDFLIFNGVEADLSLECLAGLDSVVYKDGDVTENWKGWKAWKEFVKKLKLKNYLFVERPSPYDPSYSMCRLVNIEKVRAVFEQHKEAFSQKMDVQGDFEQFLNEIDDPDSVFWNRVARDHYLSGLLYDYGEENIRQFIESMTSGDEAGQCVNLVNESAMPDEISLPTYAISKDDLTLSKYQTQRSKIKKIYQDKDFLRVTLQQLER